MSAEVKRAVKNVRETVGKLVATSYNPHFKSKYADLPSVLDAIVQPMDEFGLVFTQITGFQSDHFGLWTEVEHIETGEKLTSFRPIPVDPNPQKMGSAETYARRYGLCTILGLAVEDDDGNMGANLTSKTTQKAPEKPARQESRNGIAKVDYARMIAQIPACKNIDEVNKLRKEYAKHIQVASKEQLDGFRQAFDAKKKALAES